MYVYSQKAIDLVEEYLRRFPRLFVILSKHRTGDMIRARDFEARTDLDGMAYLAEIIAWLAELPCFMEKMKPANIIDLSTAAYDDVKRSAQETVSRWIHAILYSNFHVLHSFILTVSILGRNASVAHTGIEDDQVTREVA